MELRRSAPWLFVATLSMVVVPACSDDIEPDNTPPSGIANPASVYCVEQGGTVEIVDEPAGEVGYCNLPDGTRIEEWEYYRSQTDGSVTQP